MRVSVIVPVYNVVSFLDGAIRSVRSQNIPGMEMIVVDDGSGAEAAARINAICAGDPFIRVIRQTNQGPAAARRTGVREAKGDYILFLDADDMFFPRAITHLVSALEANPSAIAAYGTKTRINERGQIIDSHVLPTPVQAVSGDVLPALLQGIPLLSNGNICIRREALAQVVFPDAMRQGEDWVTWCRLALLGDIVFAGPEPVLGIRVHGRNASDKVLDKPSRLFGMLGVVFDDPRFVERVGVEKLEVFRQKHLAQLHGHFRHSLSERRQLLRALKYRFFCWQRDPSPEGKIRVLHVVKWFYAGGAERLLSAYLQHSDRRKFEHVVLSLSDQNERIGDACRELGISYKAVEIRREGNNFRNYLRAFLFAWRARPGIIKTWLPPANLAGGFMGKLLGVPVVWGIHNAQAPTSPNRDTRKQVSLARWLPRRIVCCSKPVYDVCIQVGHDRNKLEIITNGTDTGEFDFKPEGRRRIRCELGIGDDALLIGMAAEFIPLKRHSYFLAAAKILAVSYPEAHFLFCGRGTGGENPNLTKLIHLLDLEKRVHLLGIRNDMADIFSAMDINTLVSESESFGFSITEGMACKTLCVATGVGLMKEFLTGVGALIPVSADPGLLVDAWKMLIRLPQQEKTARRNRGRERIVSHYSLIETAGKYDRLLASIYRPARRT